MRALFRTFLWTLTACLLVGQVARAAEAKKKFEIVMVVKLEGVSWFDDMRRGIERFAKDNPDVNAYQIGHNTGDPAAQIRLVEDLIAKKVDAIIVIPNDVKAMEPVLKKANDAGILTFSHEAASLQNVTFDIEAFNNAAFGEEMMKNLAKNMKGQGQYAQIVGLLTMETHMDWAGAASKYQREKFSGMKLVTDSAGRGQQRPAARAPEGARAPQEVPEPEGVPGQHRRLRACLCARGRGEGARREVLHLRAVSALDGQGLPEARDHPVHPLLEPRRRRLRLDEGRAGNAQG